MDYVLNDLGVCNQRINYIEHQMEKPMLIISVYMQCNGEKDSYNAFVECIG